MAKSDLIQKGDAEFASQMRLFKNNIGKHAATLGLTPEQLAAQAADADYFNYVVNTHFSLLKTTQSWTVGKKVIRKGDSSGSDQTAPHELPVWTHPEPPPAVAPGVEGRFRVLLRHVKASPNYTPGIGKELGIEAVDHAAPDFATLKPLLVARIVSNHVELKWDWQRKRAFLDMCELQVDRGDGKGFVMLTFSTRTRFVDKTPLPDKPTRWAYRAVFRAGDQQAGEWSDTASVLVPG